MDEPQTQTPPEGAGRPRERHRLRTVIFMLGGALAGFLYYRLVGCSSGSCPITSNPYISTAYGGAMGFLMSGA